MKMMTTSCNNENWMGLLLLLLFSYDSVTDILHYHWHSHHHQPNFAECLPQFLQYCPSPRMVLPFVDAASSSFDHCDDCCYCVDYYYSYLSSFHFPELEVYKVSMTLHNPEREASQHHRHWEAHGWLVEFQVWCHYDYFSWLLV